ncbi:MAG: hypothetical protein FJ087_05980 [Deltaproteobacteria bacterium]|nr:hypothetical protein [Deltaproteobacteria bacterium]
MRLRPVRAFATACAVACAAACAAMLPACGSSGGTVADVPPADNGGDVPGEVGCTGAKTLVFDVPPGPLATFGESSLVIRYHQGSCPVAGATLACKVAGEGAEVATASVVTGEDGAAVVKAGTTSCVGAAFAIGCCDPADAGVACASVDLTLECNVPEVLVVSARDYHGAHAHVEEAQVLLTKVAGGKPSCAELDPTHLPPATISQKVALPGAVTLTEIAGLHADRQQAWVAVVLGSAKGGPVLAWGCEEFTLECCKKTVREVDLANDLFAAGREAWKVTAAVDLATGLPDAAKRVVSDVGGLLADPGRGLIALACGVEGDGMLRDLCTLCLTDPAHPWSSGLGMTGQDLVPAITKRAAALLTLSCPSGYGNCGTPWWSADAVADAMRGARLGATWTWPNLDAEGAAGPWTGEEDWISVTLPWPDAAAAGKTTDFTVGMDRDGVSVEVERVGLWTVNVKPHATPLAWGELTAHAIEKGLLPALYGAGGDGMPAVDSFEALVGALLGGGRSCLLDGSCCSSFAQSVTSGADPEVSGLPKEAVEQNCLKLATVMAPWLRARLLSADPGPAGVPPAAAAGFTFASLEACAVTDPDKDMVLDGWGTGTDAAAATGTPKDVAPCTLDVAGAVAGEAWTAAAATLTAVPK